MLRSSSRAFAVLVVTRAVIEAIAFACLLALAQTAGGAAPLALVPTTFGLLGSTLVLIAALRETTSERRGRTIVIATLGAAVLLAVVLPTHRLDLVGWLGRIIVFVFVAEVLMWRVVSLARGAIRWSDARNAAPVAASALAAVAILPLPIDRGPLAVLALVLVAACGLSLSIARSAEELSLAREGAAGPARLSSANSVVFALGIGALGAALVAPVVEQLLAATGGTLAPLFETALFYLLLPLGYLAALVFAILEPIIRRLDLFAIRNDRPAFDPESELALLREIERTRPFVIGGLEILIVVALVIVALVLLERAVRERRLALPEGAQVDRARASGLSLRETLRALFPPRPARRRPPRDDGSASAALRLVYWRLLALAETTGHGWRGQAETPAEHHRRVSGADPRWNGAAMIVAAFEDLRYGEVVPERATVARARQAIRALEAAVRT